MDKERPWKLTAQQRGQGRHHARVQKFENALSAYKSWINAELGGLRQVRSGPSLKYILKEYQLLKRNVRAEIEAQKRAILEDVQTRFRKEQPFKDVQRQSDGHKMEADDEGNQNVFDLRILPPERKRTIRCLFTFVEPKSMSIEAENARRIDAVEAIASLCLKKIRNQPSPAKPDHQGKMHGKDIEGSNC
ncbi:MAG: hypothetical protein MMC23_009843 [Stictis urceolatum]|nr:hypothetical protein [Stictis urceolata]